MKKTIKMTAVFGVLALGTLVNTVSTYAVGVNTETDAGFQAGGSVEPETPFDGGKDTGVPDVINGSDGGQTATIGGVTMTYVPTISFGTGNAIALSEANYKAVTEKISIPGDGAEGKTEYYSPHFVQVGDISGKNNQWQVTVLQTVPYTHEGGTTESVLKNTRIRIYGNSVVSPLMDKAAKVSGITKSSLDYVQIPLKGSDESEGITVIRNNGENVSGSIISSAFAKDYKLEDYYSSEKGVTEAGKKESRYDGVILNVPKGENIQEGTYKGKLEWTFTVAQ